MMKAMLVSSYGEDAEFELLEIEKPQIKSGHVLIKIAASSVNTVDTMIRKMGKELPLSPDTPAILGMDFAGTRSRPLARACQPMQWVTRFMAVRVD